MELERRKYSAKDLGLLNLCKCKKMSARVSCRIQTTVEPPTKIYGLEGRTRMPFNPFPSSSQSLEWPF